MKEDVRVGRSVTIPGDELEMSFSTSGGPGGQHANKTATRVELTWNVATSRALSSHQRDRVMSRLAHRIDSAGRLRLTSDAHRSQLRNRDDVLERLKKEVAAALRPVKPRRPTKPTAAGRERRLQAKRRRSEIKRLRRDDDV